MKTIKQIQEGFFQTSGGGLDSYNEKRKKEIVQMVLELDDSIKEKYIDVLDDMSVNIRYFSVTILELDITELPVQFNEVGGNFTISGCDKLKTLKGVPKKVTGDYNIQLCKGIKQYDYQPEYVGESVNLVGLKCITLDIKTKCKMLTVRKSSCSNILLNERISKVWLENNKKLNTLGDCKKVLQMTLTDIPNIKDLQPLNLRYIETLVVTNSGIINLKGLPREIQRLCISKCKDLVSLEGLSESILTELVLGELKNTNAEIPDTKRSNNLFIDKCPGISIPMNRKPQWNSVYINNKRVY